MSVQQALRDVAVGPDPNFNTVVLSSTAWLQGSDQHPDTREHPSDGHRPRSVTPHTGQD